MIFCEFNYCIYNKERTCILQNVSVSPLGMCNDCLIPDIDNETLDKYKKEMLQRFASKIIKENTK